MKRHRSFVTLLCLSAGLLILPPFGQADDLVDFEDESMLFQDIDSVYSASKYEQKVTDAPARVSIVTAEEIQRYGYRTMAEVLNSLPGFYTSYDRSYGYAGVRGFSVPGDYNTKILLLINGHRVNDNVYNSMYIDRIFPVDLDLIKRIEVVRGPSSSLYGSSAFFGIINIITHQGRDLQGVKASASGGSFNSYQGSMSYGQRYDSGLEVLLSGTYADGDGDDHLYFAEFDDPLTNNGYSEDMDNESVRNFFAQFSYGPFTLDGAYVNREKRLPTAPYGVIFNDPQTESWDKHTYFSFKYQDLLDNGLEVTARLSYDDYRYNGKWPYDYSDEGDLSVIGVYLDEAKGEWWSGELLLTKTVFDINKITGGIEYRESIMIEQREFDDYDFYLDESTDEDTYGLFLQDEITLLDTVILNLGLRYDYFDSVGSTTNPRVALIYAPSPQTNLKLLYGTAFRAPNAYELYYQDGDDTQKRPDNLDPEEIESYEFIVEQHLNDNMRVSGSVFHNKLDSLITLTLDPADDLLVFANSSDATATGFELQFDGKWSNGWTTTLSYTYQDTEDTHTGSRLANSPLNMVKGNILVPLWKELLLAGLEVQYENGRTTLADADIGDVFVTNLTLVSRNILQGLTLSASLYNLFDEDYNSPVSFEHVQDSIEQNGRTFRIKLDYTF